MVHAQLVQVAIRATRFSIFFRQLVFKSLLGEQRESRASNFSISDDISINQIPEVKILIFPSYYFNPN